MASRAGLPLALVLVACSGRPPCRSPAAALVGAWDPAARERVAGALNEVPGDAAARRAVTDDADRTARAWTDARATACEARRADRPRFAARVACQDVAREALAVITARLARPDPRALERAPAALLAVRRLVAACDRPAVAALLTGPDPGALARPAVALAFGDPPTTMPSRTYPPGPVSTDRRPADARASPVPSDTHAAPVLTDSAALAHLLRGWSLLAAGRPTEAAAADALLARPALAPFTLELRAAARPADERDAPSAPSRCAAATRGPPSRTSRPPSRPSAAPSASSTPRPCAPSSACARPNEPPQETARRAPRLRD